MFSATSSVPSLAPCPRQSGRRCWSSRHSTGRYLHCFQYIYKLNIYSIREFGELSEGETHLLVNNNPIHFSNGTAMMLTLDCGVVCGQVSRQNCG